MARHPDWPAYLDRQRLKASGAARARAIDYRKWESARWDRLLDGILVLREERPPRFVRDARPVTGR